MELRTCQEWITRCDKVENNEQKHPDVIWVSALDLLDHCLQGDTSKTIYKNPDAERKYLDELREAMQDRGDLDSFEHFENAFNPVRKWRETQSDDGDFDVDLFLEHEHDTGCPFFVDTEQVYADKPALDIVMDLTIPYADRDKPYMVERHKHIYSVAAKAESENRPCRVLAVSCLHITERRDPISIVTIIKDFSDPIFPAIWGAMKTTATANSFLNVIMDYFIGTYHGGNGNCTQASARAVVDSPDVDVIKGKFILDDIERGEDDDNN